MAENLRQDLIRSKEEEQKASCLHTKIWVQTEELRKELCTAVGIPSTPWESIYTSPNRPTLYNLSVMHFFPDFSIELEFGDSSRTFGQTHCNFDNLVHEENFNAEKEALQRIFPEFTNQLEALILFTKRIYNEHTLSALLQGASEDWEYAQMQTALSLFEGVGTEKNPEKAMKLLEEYGGAEKVIDGNRISAKKDAGRLAFYVGNAYRQGRGAGVTYVDPFSTVYFYDLARSLQYDVPQEMLFSAHRKCVEKHLWAAEGRDPFKQYDKVMEETDSAKMYLDKGVGNDEAFQRLSLSKIYWLKANCYNLTLRVQGDKHLKSTLHNLALASQYGNVEAVKLAYKICFSASFSNHAEVTGGEYGLSYWVPIWTSFPTESYLNSILFSCHLGIEVADKYESAYEQLGKEGNTSLLYVWAVLLGNLTSEKVEVMEHIRSKIEQWVLKMRFSIHYYSAKEKEHHIASLGHLYYRLALGYDNCCWCGSYEEREKKAVIYYRMYLVRELHDIYDKENQFIKDVLVLLLIKVKNSNIDSIEKQQVVQCLKSFVERPQRLTEYEQKTAKEIIAYIEYPFLSKLGFK